jgi:sugar phosphate isomerase/epimerase
VAFQYACADFTFPLLPHDKVIALIALLGFNGVDIGLFENRSHLQPSTVLHQAEKNGKRLLAKTADEGLQVADVFLQCDVDFWPKAINHPENNVRKETRDYFTGMIEYALAAGSKHITCLPGVPYAEESFDISYARALEELAWRVDEAKKAGLIFGIEPHLGGIVDSPSKAMKLIGELPGITITLDYTHFTKIGIPDKDVEPLIPYASHFHARGAKEGALQTVLPENTIDYQRIVHQMKKSGYAGFVGIEYIWMDWEGCNRTDNVSESLRLKELMKKAENGGY